MALNTESNGYRLALKNAKRHLKVANQVAENENYGIANSLLILAAEERIKAFIYFIGEHKEKRKVLFKHKLKHRYLWHIKHSSIWAREMGETIGMAIVNILSKKLKNNKQKERKLVAKAKYSKNEIRQWFNKAEKQKQKGFYVDYIDGKWVTPFQVKKTDFDKSLYIVNDTFKTIGGFEKNK